MKKINILAVSMGLFMVSCGSMGTTGTSSSSSSSGSVLGNLLGAVTNGESISNAISSVIGLDKLTSKGIVGTWKYDGPGCAFTSENALAEAGGEIAATQVEEKLQAQYDKLGLTSSNTYITFSDDGKFSSKIAGKSFSGKWTLDESTGQLTLKATLLSLNGYAKRNGSGISVLFESKKLLTLMQTMASLSGNSTLQAVGDISKNYDGVRIGFDLQK